MQPNQNSNEKGYTLVLTLFVILLFTILATSLMTLTLAGAKKNQVSQSNIQKVELANQGVEFITAQIYHELEEELKKNAIDRSRFIDLLEETLNNYKTELNSISSSGETGKYDVYISDIVDAKDANGVSNPIRKRVTFKSTGTVHGQKKLITTEVEIGAKSTLETLKYAVGANKCIGTNCTQLNGEGNMFLHGGVSIQGDFKVDGNLITTNRGYASYTKNGTKNDLWIPSVYPSALPSQGETNAHLVLGGKVYTFTNNPIYDNHVPTVNFGSSYSNKTNNISAAFKTGESPIIVNRQITRDEIKISDQKAAFYFNKNSGIRYIDTRNNAEFTEDINMTTDKVYPRNRDCFLIFCSDYSFNDHFTFTKNNSFKSFATEGSLTIKSSTSSFKKTKFENGAYIEGNLTIGNNDSSDNINNYDQIQIDGPLFVNGDVTIRGANAQFNAIMYVMGNVTIEHSQINGLGNNGSLIIFAKKGIKISNNSVNLDNPSTIKGFFFSEEALEIYGVGSNIRIEGGVSARRIVLNAIRGSASNKTFPGAQETAIGFYEGIATQPNKNSRLQIIYNPYIMNTYADIKSREPIITSIDPPQLINRYD